MCSPIFTNVAAFRVTIGYFEFRHLTGLAIIIVAGTGVCVLPSATGSSSIIRVHVHLRSKPIIKFLRIFKIL